MMNQKPYTFLSSTAKKQLARVTAYTSGVFILITSLMLLNTFIEERTGVPEKERIFSYHYNELKAQLRDDPQNEELKLQVRELDFAMRQDYFIGKTFMAQGKYYLLVGIILFLISVKYLASLHPVPRNKKNKHRNPEQEAVNKRHTREVVYGIGIVLTVCVLGMTAIPLVEIPVATPVVEIVETFPTPEELAQNWHRFRGAGGLGITTDSTIPTYWDEDSGEGIGWKVEVPLPGHNSPIVWGERVFLSGANPEEKSIFCFSTLNGELLWQHSFTDVPVITQEEVHVFMDTGYAAATMVCDGYRVFAIFADGVIGGCTLEGKRVWAKHLGVPENQYGLSSSLVTYENLVLVQFDQGSEDDELSSLFALDSKNGTMVWQTKRPVAGSWASPVLINTTNHTQYITCSEPWVISYLPSTGEELWRAHLLGMDVAPSPIYENDMVFVTQPNEMVYAIDPSGSGDITETHVTWELDFPAPDITSPAAKDGLMYLLAGGFLSCHDINNNGEVIWEEDIEDTFSASPTLVNDLLYLISNDGAGYLVKAGTTFERLEATCKIKDKVYASPAFNDGQMFIRSQSYLYGIVREKSNV